MLKSISFFIFIITTASINCANIKPSHFTPTKSNSIKSISKKDIELLQIFSKEYEINDGWSAEEISENLFDKKIREKAIDSFKGKNIDANYIRDFKARYQNDYFYNYDYEESKSFNFKVFQDDYDENEYRLRKQFALHMAKKVGDYHFNRYIKYHPRIKKVVQSVENIDVTVDISNPKIVDGKPQGKPTKLKFKINPFKKELKCQLIGPIAETDLKYKINDGALGFNLNKKSDFANLSFAYDIARIKFNRKIKQPRTFSGSVDRNIYKDINAKLEVKGENGAHHPTVAHLVFSIPLHAIF